MNTITFGKARIETGVRIETTQSSFTGYDVKLDADRAYVSTTPVRGDNLYMNVLPSVNFQYAFTPDTKLRAGYGRGIARPNFSDLPPYVLEDDSAQQVFIGNSALKPTTANNFDLLGERNLRPLGLIQAGVFYKDLNKPIFSLSTLIPSRPQCRLPASSTRQWYNSSHIWL